MHARPILIVSLVANVLGTVLPLAPLALLVPAWRAPAVLAIFLVVVVNLTVIGTFFRGPNWDWVWPWLR